MRRTTPQRLFALLVALVVSLTAPTQALAHGIVHEHLAHHGEHAGAPGVEPGHAAALIPAVDGASGDHRHAHLQVQGAPAGRTTLRLAAPPIASLVPSPVTLLPLREPEPTAALPVRSLLARPDPGGGAPPAPRAPPSR